ncbi:hypothetical protein SAMN05443245_5493 [Paraburkholderia fungorum]|uniref:Acyltransferase n=1 Tax=Paraburkholderia fungorum TaxID=134537 RepID=A0A1H1IRC2_9BURK|nr:acyltransferase [Paraburkholderia fungorum]SDR39838.1 hypothetical protein SAMN05443245_5493 [Paraburkholderia fungorum]
MNRIEKAWLRFRSIPKTLYFNFRYLPFSQAIKLPFAVSSNTYLLLTKGKVHINAPLTRGMIQIGFGEVYTFDQHRSRTMWCVDGEVTFEGTAHIGHGSRIHVGGELVLGNNFVMTAESQIICNRQIKFGSDVLISWECMFMDNDFHKIMVDRQVVNDARPILVGNHVWFGCRCTVLKGSEIGDNIVVAATSTVTGKHRQPNTIIGGMPLAVLKESIEWEA